MVVVSTTELLLQCVSVGRTGVNVDTFVLVVMSLVELLLLLLLLHSSLIVVSDGRVTVDTEPYMVLLLLEML